MIRTNNGSDMFADHLADIGTAAADAYLECLAWSSTVTTDAPIEGADIAEDGSGSDEPYWIYLADSFDWSDDAEREQREDLQAFWESLPATVRLRLVAFTPRWDPTRFAHDYALTRNGHGAGYWGRDAATYSGLNDYLTEWAQSMGGVDLYLTDDNELSVM